jgi:hypothetical protein
MQGSHCSSLGEKLSRTVFIHSVMYAAFADAHPSQLDTMYNDTMLVQPENNQGAHHAFKQALKNLRAADGINQKALQ